MKNFIIYDKNVSRLLDYPEIRAFQPAARLGICADGKHKTMTTVLKICRWLMMKEAGRDARLIALGGGTVSDITGFAAGIYKRGISYVNVPTTLLALADASTGGKTGVNLGSYKNMIGVFKNPDDVIICPDAISSLPERELRSGFAEILKSFIIDNEGGHYEKAVQTMKDVRNGSRPAADLMESAATAAEVKHRIVRSDPHEKGLRRVLNLGHTWGHAIEWYEGSHGTINAMSHGEAVAIGMIHAAGIAVKIGLAEQGFVDKLTTDFEACGLPVGTDYPEDILESAVRKDKKATGDGKVAWVLPESIGKVIIRKI